MIIDDIATIRNAVTNTSPLIHCITNPISIHQCANTVLAVGGRPIMAEHPGEVEEITATAQALFLNLGNITDVRMEAMMLAAHTARERGIPIVLDAVGIACSGLRRQFAKKILQSCTPAIIKGNYSEIHALYSNAYTSSGVDADGALNANSVSRIAVSLAQKLGSAILASGKTDIVADSRCVTYLDNGCRQLASVTGTGCMLGTLAACYLPAGSAISAAVTACAVLGISGERSTTEEGNGSFMLRLQNNLCTLRNDEIQKNLKMEINEIEKL